MFVVKWAGGIAVRMGHGGDLGLLGDGVIMSAFNKESAIPVRHQQGNC
mgnify:CR=1 FL=1